MELDPIVKSIYWRKYQEDRQQKGKIKENQTVPERTRWFCSEGEKEDNWTAEQQLEGGRIGLS